MPERNQVSPPSRDRRSAVAAVKALPIAKGQLPIGDRWHSLGKMLCDFNWQLAIGVWQSP
jgi:hypothetical protein